MKRRCRVDRTEVAALLCACAVLGGAPPARAQGAAGEGAAAAEASTAVSDVTAADDEAKLRGRAPWRGSLLSLRTEASLLTFDRGAELTYNPYVALTFDMRPRWWFGRIFYLAADFSLTRELTNADETTKEGETWLGDLNVGGGASRFFTIPGAGIDLSADVRVVTPTSKLSRARTMQAALRGGLTLSRRFRLLDGLTISYLLQGTQYFHRHTTSELESPLIGGCAGDASECDRFANTGLRNARFRLVNSGSIGMDFLPWLGLDVTAMHLLDFLYPAADSDPRISLVPQEPTDRRHALAYEVELRFTPMKSLGVGVGISALNPLQAPDSSNYRPFVNRYTMAYVEIRLFVDGLVSQIAGEE